MNEPELSGALTVRTFGFNIPCRRFMLAAKVTRDRRMPLVDEFVLRVLKLAEQLTLDRLAGFFGFSLAEVQTVITDLVSRSLVVIDGENVRLHASAQEMLRTTSDGVPTILEVESWIEILWFDLISGSMIPHGIRRGMNLVDIAPPASHEKVSAEFARSAFEDNFREYLRHYRKMHNPDAFSLYAITDVQPTQYGHVAIAGTEELVLHPQPKLQPSLLEMDGDRPQRARKLSEAMRRAYDDLSHPEPSGAARAEYARLTNSTSVQEATGADGYLDLQKWQRADLAQRPAGVATLIGSSYLERNRQSFRALIEERISGLELGHHGALPELLWLRPAGSSWGASDDLRIMLSEARAVVRGVSERRALLRTTLFIPPVERTNHPRRFKRLFDYGLLVPPGHLPPAIEVILIPRLVAAVLVWVALSDSCSVWVGRATNREQDVVGIGERLRLTELRENSKQLWPDARTDLSRSEK